jgi:hypothetical protein
MFIQANVFKSKIKIKITMKKIILFTAFIFAAFIAQAQQPSINKMDSTKASITVAPQNYTYTNVYTVVSAINVNQSNWMPLSMAVNSEDSITISASVILYASKSAYTSGAQSLSSLQVYFKWPSSAILPDHYTIKKNIYSKL